MTRVRMIGPALLTGLLLLTATASAQNATKKPGTSQTGTKQSAMKQSAIKDAAAARADVKATFGFVPEFMQQIPDVALASAWQGMKNFEMNPNTKLSPKAKDLIGLAVASQIPCEYCVYAHTEFAKLNGATEDEIDETIAMAALSRELSTFVGGTQQDEAKFRADVDRWVAHAKSQNGIAPAQIEIVDAQSALQDAKQTFGSVPAFIERVPPEALPGFWQAFKDIRFGKTSLDEETKLLITVAVSAQTPCEKCVVAQSEFAKVGGTTEAEISEAIAMAGAVRNWSTMLHGAQVSKATFRRDINRLVRVAKRENGDKPKQTARRTQRTMRASRPQ